MSDGRDEMPGPSDWIGPPEVPGDVEAATLEDLKRATNLPAATAARAVKLARLLDRADEETSGVAAIARQHQLTMDEVRPYMAAPVADPVDEIAKARAVRVGKRA